MRRLFLCTISLLLGAATSYSGELENISGQLDAIQAAASERGLAQRSDSASLNLLTAYAQTFDPGARIFSSDGLHSFENHQKGRDRGFGFLLGSTGSAFAVTGYLEDAPAAGTIPVPAQLTHLGTHSLQQLSLSGIQSLIRQADTNGVPLTYLTQDGVSNTVTATAGEIQLPVIALAEELPGALAYLRLNGLYAGSSREVVSKIRSWSETDCYGFILDLRNAGGTDEEAVQNISSLFAAEGSFLYALRDDSDQDLSVCTALAGGPIAPAVMVLTDEQTVGAAELLAAVLSGSGDRVMVIGAPTAGDPLIRETVPLNETLFIYLASKKVVTEDGTVLAAGDRLIPDIRVKPASEREPFEPSHSLGKTLSEEELEDRALRDRVRHDPPLRRAVDLLLGLQALNIQPPERP